MTYLSGITKNAQSAQSWRYHPWVLQYCTENSSRRLLPEQSFDQVLPIYEQNLSLPTIDRM